MTVRPGLVYLVGAGPGDPGLITVRGHELLQRADVVLHDRLVSSVLLECASPTARLLDVGKTPWEATTSQGEINAALVAHAARGMVVVRLKGGDPWVFGRGWEEWEACRQAGIPCQLVPGITSAIAGPAAAGIPVTTRGVASSVVFIAAPDVSDRHLDAAVSADTAVFLMGVRTLPALASRLIARGKDAATPAAVVERATLPGQRVVRARLDLIASVAANAGLSSPAVIVVGQTASYGEDAAGPLSGRRIIVTRPLNAAQQLTNGLRALGAQVFVAPLISVSVLDDAPDDVVHRMDTFDWMVFSSRHGVRGFRRIIDKAGRDARAFAHAKIAAVGPITAQELSAWGLRADLVAEPARADALIRALASQPVLPGRVLFPCGTLALDAIPAGLGQLGVHVEKLVVYETRTLPLEERVRAELRRGVDAVLFASPSSALAMRDAAVDIGSTRIICIGPTTAAAATSLGGRGVRVADEHSDAGLIAATVAALPLEGHSR